MQSTCSRSASAATRATSAARFAKSAARIEGAIFIAPEATALRLGHAFEHEHEHAVGARVGRAAGARRARAAATAPAGGARRRTRAARTRPTRRRRASPRCVSVHTEYTSRPPGLHRARRRARAARAAARRGRATSSRLHAASARRAGGAARRGRCTARRAARGRTRRRARRAGGRRRRAARPYVRAPRRAAARMHRAHAAGVQVGGDDEPVVRPCARRRRSPCRRAPPRRRARARPVAGRAATTTAWLAWSCGVARPSRRARAARRGRRCGAASSASGTSVPGSTSTPAAAARRSASSSVVRSGLTRSVTGGGSLSSVERRDARRRRRTRRRSVCTIQSGCDVRTPIDSTSSPCGQRPRRPAARERAQHAVGEAASALASTTSTVSPTAACGGTPIEAAGYAPSRSAARTSGSSESSGRVATAASRWSTRPSHAHRAVHEIGDERAVARRRGRAGAAAAARGCARTRRLRCAAARRARARRGVSRVDSRGVVTRRRGLGRAAPRATRRASIARLPSGCTSSSTSAPSAVPSTRVGRDQPRLDGGSPTAVARRHDLHALPPTVTTRPGAGCRRARCGRARRRADGSSRNSSDGELVGVGRLRRPAAPGRARERRELVDEQLGAGVDETRVQLARGLRRTDRHPRRRVHRTGVEAGLDAA